MGVSQEYIDYVIGQLSSFGEIQAKRMFGGVGLYHRALFFALIAEDTLYFKADASNRDAYLKQGMQAFQPGKNKSVSMNYFTVPVEILEDETQLKEWAQAAHSVALRSRRSCQT